MNTARTLARRQGIPSTLTNALGLPGVSGNFASTPDSVANSIGGDIDVRVHVAASDWTPAADQILMAKVTATGVISWQWFVLTSGKLRFFMTRDGSSGGFGDSTVATGFADGTGQWVRFTRLLSTGHIQFFTSADGASWTQLGTDVLAFGAGVSIFDSTAPVTIGARGDGGSPLHGNIYYAELRSGIGGTVVQSFDATVVTRLGIRNPSTVTAGGPWTVNGSAWDWVAA